MKLPNRSLLTKGCWIFLLLGFLTELNAQKALYAKVLDADTGEPIAYVNAGIPGQGVGTVTNTKGIFALLLPEHLYQASLLLSHVGYEDHTISLPSWPKGDTLFVHLQWANHQFRAVTVTGDSATVLGYLPGKNSAVGFFQAKGLGAEGGSLIPNSDSASLKRFHFEVLSVQFDSLKFRLNLYKPGRGKPGEQINTRDIIFSVSASDIGDYSVDLSAEKLMVYADFYCTLELIEVHGPKGMEAGLNFAAEANRDGLTVRKLLSMDKWERFEKVNACFWFEALK